MFDWIKKHWSEIDDAVMGVINFLKEVLTKFAEWPILKVEI